MAGIAGKLNPMFFNRYERALDPQCRISLPSDWRNKDGETEFVMFPAVGKALVLVPGDVLAKLFEKLQDESIIDPKIQMAFAYLGSVSHIRICAPENWDTPSGESTVEKCLGDIRNADSEAAKKLAGFLSSIISAGK